MSRREVASITSAKVIGTEPAVASRYFGSKIAVFLYRGLEAGMKFLLGSRFL